MGETDKLLNNYITWGKCHGVARVGVAECQRIFNRKTNTTSGIWGGHPRRSELSENEQVLGKQRETEE